jgi:uncharacterized phiE125 gp8 family phage protein
MMETVLKTGPVVEPISLDEAKRHVRISIDDSDQDDYLQDLIVVAREQVEVITWRKLVTQTWYAYLQDWPSGEYIELPFGSLQSVTPEVIDGVSGIKYIGSDATEYAWASTEYIVGTDYQKGRITLADGCTWPNETLYPSNPIVVEFICGYGLAVSVPAQIKHAMKMIISELFENREITIIGTIFKEMETVNNLLSNFRLNEL